VEEKRKKENRKKMIKKKGGHSLRDLHHLLALPLPTKQNKSRQKNEPNGKKRGGGKRNQTVTSSTVEKDASWGSKNLGRAREP